MNFRLCPPADYLGDWLADFFVGDNSCGVAGGFYWGSLLGVICEKLLVGKKLSSLLGVICRKLLAGKKLSSFIGVILKKLLEMIKVGKECVVF